MGSLLAFYAGGIKWLMRLQKASGPVATAKKGSVTNGNGKMIGVERGISTPLVQP